MADPFPTERVTVPVMLQTWAELTFLHWAYEPDQIRSLVPAELELDTFEDQAWVTLSPFLMRGLRPPTIPSLPWLPEAPETNLRTYVRSADGRVGIHFFSLDISWLLAALVGRTVYRLPYMWARADVRSDGSILRYRGSRRWGGATASWDIAVERGRPLAGHELSSLDHFLTARWLLYARYGRAVAATPAEHEPWSLNEARLIGLEQDLLAAAGIPAPRMPPLIQYSPGVRTRIGLTRPINGEASRAAECISGSRQPP
jgi:uncharacterized protein YqjF (DUF2071 family)